MSDVNCAHCGEPWEVWGLRNEGWGYHSQGEKIPNPKGGNFTLNVDRACDDKEYARKIDQAVYTAVLSGKGCPSCGYAHGKKVGEHRTTQLHQLVIDGVTDDDVLSFL